MVRGFNNNLHEYVQLEDFFVLTLMRPALWHLRVLCALLAVKKRINKRKTHVTVEIASRLFVLALLVGQKVLAYFLQRERA